MPQNRVERALIAALAALALPIVILALWPRLDIAVSSLVFDPATRRFALDGQPLAEALRLTIWKGAAGLFLLSLAGLAASVVLRRAVAGLPARAWGFVVLLFLLGPGLLVETLLKKHWDRARPADIAEFGGAALFTPFWQPADQCARNCSFVAGEAAGGLALALAVGLMLLWWRGRIARPLWQGLAVLAAAAPLVAAAQRLAAGRHFLSDILCAFLIVGLVALLLGRILSPLPPPVDKAPDSSY